MIKIQSIKWLSENPGENKPRGKMNESLDTEMEKLEGDICHFKHTIRLFEKLIQEAQEKLARALEEKRDYQPGTKSYAPGIIRER